jgi:hypothetical protein
VLGAVCAVRNIRPPQEVGGQYRYVGVSWTPEKISVDFYNSDPKALVVYLFLLHIYMSYF